MDRRFASTQEGTPDKLVHHGRLLKRQIEI
jgi:hypothetical protein